jgi:hypothetical protein
MESTLRNQTLGTANAKSTNAIRTVFWIFTALFCLQMLFTAYYELFYLPAGAQAFTRLGFPSYFRIELSWAKVAGVAVLLIPMIPARLKEWAYAGFAINLVSALIAHFSLGEGPASWLPSAITSVLWSISYFSWRRLPGSRWPSSN